jgi:acyl-CoA synthetase (AMP-forming)/AMP-acid ligase II
MTIVDRSKDAIKSGGEWISSIELENAAAGHPGVAQVAVVGLHHPKWDERPLMLCVVRPDSTVTEEGLRQWLSGRVPKWWLPERIRIVEQLPYGTTGKLLKAEIREQYATLQYDERGHLVERV